MIFYIWLKNKELSWERARDRARRETKREGVRDLERKKERKERELKYLGFRVYIT